MALTYFETFVSAFTVTAPASRLLDGDYVLCPPNENYGYESTPKNGVTFATMGVDGVHWAILKIQGEIRDDSPVAHVSPMDSEAVTITGESFLSFLAEGCGISAEAMNAVFQTARSGENRLVDFLSEHFDRCRLFDEGKMNLLTARYQHLIERK